MNTDKTVNISTFVLFTAVMNFVGNRNITESLAVDVVSDFKCYIIIYF